jgi:hypothetical protein
LKTVIVQMIALLLAVLMMTGGTAQVCASPEVTSLVDDAPELDAPILPARVTAPPVLREPVCIEAPRCLARGRTHAVFVFRPPRQVASR